MYQAKSIIDHIKKQQQQFI